MFGLSAKVMKFGVQIRKFVQVVDFFALNLLIENSCVGFICPRLLRLQNHDMLVLVNIGYFNIEFILSVINFKN
jgi:hypothetical protein